MKDCLKAFLAGLTGALAYLSVDAWVLFFALLCFWQIADWMKDTAQDKDETWDALRQSFGTSHEVNQQKGNEPS